MSTKRFFFGQLNIIKNTPKWCTTVQHHTSCAMRRTTTHTHTPSAKSQKRKRAHKTSVHKAAEMPARVQHELTKQHKATTPNSDYIFPTHAFLHKKSQKQHANANTSSAQHQNPLYEKRTTNVAERMPDRNQLIGLKSSSQKIRILRSEGKT